MRRVYQGLSSHRRRQLRGLIAFMVLGAFAELVALGAVLPFLTLLTDPARALEIGIVREIFGLIGGGTDRLLMVMTGAFIAAVIVAAVIRVRLAWVTNNVTHQIGHDMAVEIQQRILYQDYMFHVSSNSSEILASLQKVAVFVHSVMLQLAAAAVSSVIAIFIIAGLFYINWQAALMVGFAFVTVYSLVMIFSRRRLARYSTEMADAYSARLKLVQESLGGIRDIIIDKTQPLYIDAFRRIDRRLTSALTNTEFLGASPRFVIEAAGMLIIALAAFAVARQEGGLLQAIPVLGALALGAQRLLPLLQQVYVSWNALSSRKAIAQDILGLLSLPLPDRAPQHEAPPLPFNDGIDLENISFAYPGRDELILADVNLAIRRGARVALVGRSGSGKSTLIDLVMGLLEPTDGQILIDRQPIDETNRDRWQQNIAHVPQSIFLADATIAQNIAMRASDSAIDWGKVEAAARRAQLLDFIRTLPQRFATPVGERGIRLSGGQRQRVGIARALYKEAKVLILDEATSALDHQTEGAVVKSLEELGSLTVIMVAHRLSTIANCDTVIRLEQGRVVQIGSYAEVVGGHLREERR